MFCKSFAGVVSSICNYVADGKALRAHMAETLAPAAVLATLAGAAPIPLAVKTVPTVGDEDENQEPPTSAERHAIAIAESASYYPSADAAGTATGHSKKNAWTAEEDALLHRIITEQGHGHWTQVAAHLPGRMGRQCRERWFNHLAPEVKKGDWSKEEDELIVMAVREHGTKWSLIQKSLPGRSDNAIKNRYYSAIRKAQRLEKRGSASGQGGGGGPAHLLIDGDAPASDGLPTPSTAANSPMKSSPAADTAALGMGMRHSNSSPELRASSPKRKRTDKGPAASSFAPPGGFTPAAFPHYTPQQLLLAQQAATAQAQAAYAYAAGAAGAAASMHAQPSAPPPAIAAAVVAEPVNPLAVAQSEVAHVDTHALMAAAARDAALSPAHGLPPSAITELEAHRLAVAAAAAASAAASVAASSHAASVHEDEGVMPVVCADASVAPLE